MDSAGISYLQHETALPIDFSDRSSFQLQLPRDILLVAKDEWHTVSVGLEEDKIKFDQQQRFQHALEETA